ncbi:MAG: DUF4340 domain-containing protein [Planctomycetota bacterium]|nr:DUF4340 domain-containing protein [Planctomycetota bacterium]
MNRLTTLLLFVVVLGLGGAAFLQTGREAKTIPEDGLSEALFPGVDRSRIAAIRLEDIKGSMHLRFERDVAGQWFITDPIAWPAEQNQVLEIVQVVLRNRVVAVPDALLEQARQSFDPPDGFIEVEEKTEGGEPRRTRVELGAVDLDGMRVYVRRDGRIFRTLRNFETPFTLGLNEYRSRRIFALRADEVVALERVGGWYDQGAQQNLGMRAFRSGAGWQIDAPSKALGDPELFTLWTRFLNRLEAERIASDRSEVDLARFGLDVPWMSISATSLSGVVQTIQISSEEGRVFCRRGEGKTVFELDPLDVLRLREPVTSFLEGQFVRFNREDLKEVLIGRGANSIRIRPEGDEWVVAKRSSGLPDYSTDLPGDRRRIEDLVSVLEDAPVVQYFIDTDGAEFFPVGSRDRGVWVETRDGLVQGGAIAAATRNAEGTEVLPLLRDGDKIMGALDPAFDEVLGLSFESLLNRELWTLSNVRLRQLRIQQDGRAREWVRADSFDWRPKGTKIAARELDPVLDHLLFLKAERHIPEGEREELLDPVEVRFIGGDGKPHEARFGRTAAGEAQVQVGALRAVLARQELYGDLQAIVDRKPERSDR